MQTHEVKQKSKRTRHQQIGRGGKRGKTSGRGTKGQKARAGRKLRPEIRDQIKKIPKLRGRGINTNKPVGLPVATISVAVIGANFKDGEKVSPKILVDKKLVRKIDGRVPLVKVLGTGDIKSKIVARGLTFSKAAADKLQVAGGVVTN
ncbi:MAG: hypothetical protein A2589_02985 [Candidatus Vogelbacteria bacterium RIFOXYD1_FULL_46_19]|uniref:Large ribosomal subunit protein uL15 n=1 Tax=Candidatus Vogelbacteria bacterium RIFOXYD1_FULL_46_19 TaxID=1802439 RepID=A0A1G2QGS3_9BACT|nr:MAG: hypothetical protein A2589_02985 [Candidatus Vogelbacteria bacterium RIFOXYD1_FULL_46_19]